jgi:hypothetical protein
VPLWLRRKIWRIAAGLGNPHPSTIAVTLNHHERGRVVDRVWMRGQFLNGCDREQLAGYTFDATTHTTVSASWKARCADPR